LLPRSHPSRDCARSGWIGTRGSKEPNWFPMMTGGSQAGRVRTHPGKGVPLRSYIVHMYRSGRTPSGKMAGVVEEVGKPGRKRFADRESLWKILTESRQDPVRGSKTPGKRKKKDKMTLSEIMTRFAR